MNEMKDETGWKIMIFIGIIAVLFFCIFMFYVLELQKELETLKGEDSSTQVSKDYETYFMNQLDEINTDFENQLICAFDCLVEVEGITKIMYNTTCYDICMGMK